MLLASCCQWRPAGSGNVTNEAGDPDPAEVRTRLEREFVANLSNPGVQLAAMNWSDHDQCRWRCSNEGCGHEWTTRLVFRSRRRRPTGCPACSRRRNRAPGPGESLAELDPDLAKQFRRNLTRPDRGPETLRTQSHDLCEWECRKGHKWEATVANRTNGRGCRRCSGHGRSLFEYKVAMLVQAASGIGVEVDHRLRLPGRSEDAFDLFLKELDLLIDLDPAWTHSGQDSLARDTAKTEATLSAGRRLERIRERGLPPLPISGIAHYEAGPGVDPRTGLRPWDMSCAGGATPGRTSTPLKSSKLCPRRPASGRKTSQSRRSQRSMQLLTWSGSLLRTGPLPVGDSTRCRQDVTTCVPGGVWRLAAATSGRCRSTFEPLLAAVAGSAAGREPGRLTADPAPVSPSRK